MPENKMTKKDAARIQSSQARQGGDMSGFPARAQAAADRNATAGQQNTGGAAKGKNSVVQSSGQGAK
ncbi:hypothetical protein S7711_11191 [Stachybotrys chartarum IBT 7711]|uniref:Uncharacterized protein n=1 Tax=Stachybotrys chartarum (strain CBS 109288 / IBT 7711) TaxID=1280523 RepID=A0A084ASM7_STACB|nr:hypothetical protein S7711_11191 [Stachybotrys chartarum IBT 7711]